MKCLFPKAALPLLIVVVNAVNVFSQANLPKYEFGLDLGMLVYQGDLTPRRLGSFETQKFALGIHASRILGPVVSIRARLAAGKLRADEAIYDNPEYRKERAFSFTSPVIEFSGQLVWNLAGSNYQEKGFIPYLFAGAGVSFLRVKRDWSRVNRDYFTHASTELWAGLAADSAHNPPRMMPVAPLGGGIKYFFSSNWGVNIEATYRVVASDYLDGFSRAAEPDKKDKYMGYSAGIIYRAGKKNSLKCPVIRY